MKVLVVENDPLVAFNLIDMLGELEYPELPVADSVDLALKLVDEEKPDVVLIDIELNGERNGLDLGEILSEQNVPFIYLTGLRERPILDKALQTKPQTNLAKPVNKYQLRNSLLEVNLSTDSNNKAALVKNLDFIMVTEKDRKVRINKAEIIYLSAARNNCEIHTMEKRFLSSTPMNNVLKKINHPSFIQVHRSSIVNIEKVKGYDGNTIYFEGSKKEVIMSQSFRTNFLDKIVVV